MIALTALFFWASSCFLAVSVQAGLALESPRASSGAGDPLHRLMGGAVEAVGDTLYLKADEYFHGGVTHEHHQDETAEDFEREGVFLEPGHGSHAEKPEDWVESIHHELGIRELKHLSKAERKEMLPFFKWSTQFNPHHLDALLTTAFWLEKEFDRREEAEEVLKKGIRDNPGSWEIERDLGMLFFRADQMLSAATHLQGAIQKSGGNKISKAQLCDMNYHLAEALQKTGRPEEALARYREVSRHYDQWTTEYFKRSIEEKIERLGGNKNGI